ncbi:MAG TPA: molecular chaperone DnaJ, partial [Pseudomonadales bacterium]|nr:molecular chaperone DnaJ [Pseudomonadales bacterium]
DMSESQALDILGLKEDATKEDIIQAHRRMIQKVHPDRGGSTYLATKINAAKVLLIKIRG